MRVLQIRFYTTRDHSWEPWEDFTPGDLGSVPERAVDFEIREKPAFEPGWYITLHDGLYPKDSIRWCTREPSLDAWKRVTVVGENDDED